eukprot:2928280-Prymnesium_polylepis.1
MAVMSCDSAKLNVVLALADSLSSVEATVRLSLSWFASSSSLPERHTSSCSALAPPWPPLSLRP